MPKHYRLMAEPIEIKVDLTYRAALCRSLRRGRDWLIWKGRVLLGSRIR